jgi:parallel beta-helix repeat protein
VKELVLLMLFSGAALAQTTAMSPTCNVNSNGICSVTAFGALGDGVSDNARAFQDAFNYAAANKCGVFIPAGTFAYSGVLTVNGVAITGSGAQSILMPLEPANEAIMLTGNGASIAYLVMVSHATTRLTTPQSAMIWASGATNYRVQDVLINGSASVGVFSLSSSSGIIANNTVENTLADSISQIEGSNHIVVSGNSVVNSGDDGISNVSYAQHPEVHDITVQGNTVTNNAFGRGISVVGGATISITGNNITENVTGLSDIYIAAESEWNTLGVSNVIVSNNTLIDGGPKQGTVTIYNSQGSAYSLNGVTISGNQIITPAYVPVQFVGNGSELGTVQGNTAYGGTRFFDPANSHATFTETDNNIMASAVYEQPIIAAGGGCGFAGC